MFTLSQPAEPRWVTLIPATSEAPAVRVRVKAAESVGLVAGRRFAADARQAAAEAGREPEPFEFGFVLGVARWAGLDWEGVGAADGKATLAYSADDLERLLRQSPTAYAAFDTEVVGRLLAVDAEKNGSAPSPSGTSARAGKATAPRAPSRSGAKPASTGKAPRKPKTASGSGKR